MTRRYKRLIAALGALAIAGFALTFAPPAHAVVECQQMFCADDCYQGPCSPGCDRACNDDLCKNGTGTGCMPN